MGTYHPPPGAGGQNLRMVGPQSHRGQCSSVLDGGCSPAWPSLAPGLQAPRNRKRFCDRGPESLWEAACGLGRGRCWPCDGSAVWGAQGGGPLMNAKVKIQEVGQPPSPPQDPVRVSKRVTSHTFLGCREDHPPFSESRARDQAPTDSSVTISPPAQPAARALCSHRSQQVR